MKKHNARLLFIVLSLLPLLALFTPESAKLHHLSPQAAQSLEWSIPLLIGFIFLSLGIIKIYGQRRGIVGGGDKSFSDRCLGSCPTWSNQTNRTAKQILLGIGIGFTLWGLSKFFRIF